jgi:iron complex outermembrane receptor protein
MKIFINNIKFIIQRIDFKYLVLISALIFLLIIHPDISVCQDLKDTIEISEVQIFAKKDITEICLNITKIDTLILSQNINLTLAELISNHTSLFIKNYGKSSISTISFRGTAASHTQVLWNGISVNSPMSGQFDFSQIPVFLIDEINILYGTSTLSGTTGALGGSILLENKPDWTDNFHLQSIFEYGSFNTINSFTDLYIGNKSFKSRTRFYIEESENNFKFKNTAIPSEIIQKQENAEYQKKGIFQELYYRISSKSTISVNLWKQISDRNIPHIMSFSGYHRSENQKDNDLKLNLEYKKTNSKSDFIITNSYSTNKLNYFSGDSIYVFNQKNIFIEKTNSESISNVLKNNITYKLKINENLNFQSKFSLNFDKISITDSTINNHSTTWRTEYILYLGIYKMFSNKFSMYFLLNSILSSKKLIPIIPAIGIDFKPNSEEDLHVKTNLSKNYRIPSLNDLFWIPGGNPDLLPESSYSADLSLSYSKAYKRQTVFFEIDLFSSYIKDWIIWQPSEFQYWTAQNLQKVFSYGSEFSLKISGKISKINYQLFSNYSLTSTKNILNNKILSSENKQLIYIPKNLFNTFLKISYKNTDFKFTYIFTDKRNTSMSTENYSYTLKRYSLLNISITKLSTLKNLKINFQLSVNNIFNTQYQSVLYRAMPGRNYNFTIQFSI